MVPKPSGGLNLNAFLHELNNSIIYIKSNLWPLLVTFIALRFTLAQFKKWRNKSQSGQSLLGSSRSNGSGASKKLTSVEQARLRQQEAIEEKSDAAAEARKKRQEEERKRKNHIAKSKPPKNGRVLGNGDGGGYNPMQPHTGNSSGYKPAKRSVQRG